MRRAALADAPDAFGATLAEWSGTGDTEERWRSRLRAVEHNVLAEADGRPVGMVSATALANGDVELLSMWVAPEGRGRGVGDALVKWVRERARGVGAARVLLDVRAANSQAIALYERHGFRDIGASSAPGDPHPERRMALVLGSSDEHDVVPGR
jgi:ribosomal protein S18 acetylase RimI-like enzyme